MGTVETIIRLAIGGLLLLTNAFFVTTEFALTRVRQFPRSDFQASPGLRRAWRMTERLEIYLSGCQVGITISSIGLGVVAEPALAAVLTPVLGGYRPGIVSASTIGLVLAFAILNLLHVVVGEQAPTYLGVERARRVAAVCATPHYWWTRAMMPVIVVADRLAKLLLAAFGVRMTRSWMRAESDEGTLETGDLRRRMGELLSRGTMTGERRREILNALEIGERTVREIMVPRERIVALDTAAPIEESLATIARSRKVRYPLVERRLEAFRGTVYVPGLFGSLESLDRGEVSLVDLAHEPLTLPADLTIAEAIDRFQEAAQEMALVVDGERIVGLVTSTDAFEAIAGQLEDPFDLEQRLLDESE